MALLPDVELFPANIPGAELQEPLEKHTVPALKWWLTCRDCSVTFIFKKHSHKIDRFFAPVQATSFVQSAQHAQTFSVFPYVV